MTRGSILKSVIAFAIPLMLASILQLMYNAADVIVVGRWAGMHAIASVGATSSLYYFIVSLFNGFSLGPTVIVSQKYGEGDSEGVHRASHAALTMGFLIGILAMIVGIAISGPVLQLMGTPEGEVLDGAILYIRIVFSSMPGFLVYNYGAAVMRGVGDANRPFRILAVTGLVNVLLNLLFVIVFKMGVTGVALATLIANYLSAGIVMYFLINSDGDYKIYLQKLRLYREETLSYIKLGVPAGIQGSISNIVNMIVQSSVNSFGDVAVAGNTAAVNVETILWTALNAFSMAAITCVGQNFGAKKPDRVKKSIYIPSLCVFVSGIAISAVFLLFSRGIMNLYIPDSSEAISFGRTRMFVILPFYFLCGIGLVLSGVIRGFGYSNVSFYNTMFGSTIPLLLWLYLVFPLKRTLPMLLAGYPIIWFLLIVVHIFSLLILWKKIKPQMTAS